MILYKIKSFFIKLYWFLAHLIVDRLLFIIDYFFFFRLKKTNFLPLDLTSQKVLVIAAHSDDEILGLGGTLLKHSTLNHDITILYVTDGCKSFNPSVTRQEMVAMRRHEALNLSNYFSKIKTIFLNKISFEFTVSESLISEIAHAIQNSNPDIIYVLSPIDVNIDHTNAALASFAAIQNIHYRGRMCLYEVQTPLTYLYANRYIDITDFIENKKNILLSYKSQSVMFNSFIKIICYNKLAAIHLPNTNAAEFVRELSEEDILQLIRRSNSINKDKILIMRAKRFLRTSYKSMEKFFLD